MTNRRIVVGFEFKDADQEVSFFEMLIREGWIRYLVEFEGSDVK